MHRFIAATIAGLALLGGCLAATTRESDAPRFDHQKHLGRGVSCGDCHEAPKKPEQPYGMPAADICAGCHDKKTDKKEVTEVVAAYSALAADARAPRPASYREVAFTHAKHVGAKLDCAACHDGAKTGALANASGPLTMSSCVACHATRSVSTDCATCHSTITRGTPPATHRESWTFSHGPASRFPGERAADRCDLCHAKTQCDSCHTHDAPRDHSNAFRTSTHGLQAAVDRSRCVVCHREDSCVRCHQTQPPHSHRPGFGSPRDGHCTTCHGALDACATCHKGTPSHERATPKPPDHSPAMNCRQCHGHGQPLPHVDNGSDCNACHH